MRYAMRIAAGSATDARRDDFAVVVVAADLRVQVEELLLRDRAGIQRAEAVLDADVVERPTGETGLRIAAPDVHGVVVDVAARSGRVLHRVVPQRLGQRAVLADGDAARVQAVRS